MLNHCYPHIKIGSLAVMEFHEAFMRRLLQIGGLLHLRSLIRTRGPKYAIMDNFPGLDKAEAVKRIFGRDTDEVLRNLKVEFTWIGGYMWVDGSDGHLMINSKYLENGDKVEIYLDIIHELVHVRQYREGKHLFDSRYSYVDRPTEIEAYRYAVEEARRLGLSDQRICRYLKTEWMSKKDFRKLAENLNVESETR